MSKSWQIREVAAADHEWVEQFMEQHWLTSYVVVRGEVIFPANLPGFACTDEDTVLGLLTYRVQDSLCEIISLDSLREGEGIGTALIQAACSAARKQNCQKVFLITTNDNLPALGFYQKRGFCINAVFPGAVTQSRQMKPEIPLLGISEIPIRDEIELTFDL
jgi:ribosomal protein S18 acetylase RimI-like enzyme